MSEPIKPAGWLVLDPEGGYEYGCMDPDFGRDFCHDHIKDAQESGIPRARKWVVRESFSRDQVEQATAELRAEVERLRAERDHSRACFERASALIHGIHALLYPPHVTLPDGRTMAFRPSSLDPHEVLQELSNRIRALPDELDPLKEPK